MIGKGSAQYIQADLYKVEDCKKIAEELKKKETKLHVLVNNSGSNWGAPYDEFPESAVGLPFLPYLQSSHLLYSLKGIPILIYLPPVDSCPNTQPHPRLHPHPSPHTPPRSRRLKPLPLQGNQHRIRGWTPCSLPRDLLLLRLQSWSPPALSRPRQPSRQAQHHI